MVFVISKKKIERPDVIYNLHVEDNHNYVANDLVVSNCHHAGSADTLQKIMEKSTEVDRRIGLTGTIHDLPVHKMILEGLFGEIYVASTTKELIEKGIVAPINIKVMLLKYDEIQSKIVSKLDYNQEVEHVVNLENRRKFIKNLVLSLKGNTVVLFNLVEKHGKQLYDELKSAAPDGRRVYFIYGGVAGEDRERIRQILSTDKDAILVGSLGTVSTGLDAPSLKNLVFVSGSGKSKIKVLQSIGRVLRKYQGAEAVAYDIGDDLTYKKKQNRMLKHSIDRIKLYAREDLPYKVYPIELNKKK